LNSFIFDHMDNRDRNSDLAEEEEEQTNTSYETSSESEEEVNEESSLEKVGSSASIQNLPNSKSTKTLAKSDKESTGPKVIFNVAGAQYSVVKHIGKKVMGWTLTSNPSSDWDICWVDKTVPIETLVKMRPYQKINHFPGIKSIARKNSLGQNLMRMMKAFPKNYKFFPKTFLLPSDFYDFKNQFSKAKKAKNYIIKPEASCQGKGIFLTRSWENVNPKDHLVAQKYINNPYLIDGLKFDLRLYVLLAGCDPLRIYLHEEGLGRFATEKYVPASAENLANTFMHLTNYAINKGSPNFVFNNSSTADDIGHKKSLQAVFKILENEGHDTKTLWKEIKKIIIKTFCSVQPILANNYRTSHPNEPYNNMCFEVLGFDIMLDSKLKPWLIEVNHLPSFTTDTPLDRKIKENVVRDALQIMNVSAESRLEYKNKRKNDLSKLSTPKRLRMTQEEREAASEVAQKERDEWESKNHGGYEKIFPLSESEKTEDSEEYEEFIKFAQQSLQAWGVSGGSHQKASALDSANGKRDTVRNSVKRDESQENLIKETESQEKKRQKSQYRKQDLNLPSPKYIPNHTAKRTPSTKAFNGILNDSNSFSSFKTATSTQNKVDDLHQFNREAYLGPWDHEKLTEDSDGYSFEKENIERWKEEIQAIEEKHNEDEEAPLTNAENSTILTKSAKILPKVDDLEKGTLTESNLTQRENLAQSFSSTDIVKSVYRRAKSVNRTSMSFKTPSKKPSTPVKKQLQRVIENKGTQNKETKKYCPPPLRKPVRASYPDRKEPASALLTQPSEQKKEDTVSTASPMRVRPPPKTDIKKSSKLKPQEDQDLLPKKVSLTLGKDTIASATLKTVDQEVKKAWPSSPNVGKIVAPKADVKINQANNRPQSPHYYKVQLTKDASPVTIVEVKLNNPRTESQKTENKSKKLNLCLQDNDLVSAKPVGSVKDLSTKSVPKSVASPKAGRVAYNNFF